MQPDKINSGTGGDILIVEDSPTQAEKLRYLIEGNGYRARVAGNGQLALEAIRHSKPRLVLSDIMMPEMDGYALCHAIKSDPANRSIPVILVTSLVDPTDIVRGLECGADNFVRKPYAEHYLLSRIEHVLMNQQLRREPEHGKGIALYLEGQTHVIDAEPQQVLDLLISTYEQAVQVNDELRKRERQVNELNVRLAQHATQLEATNQEIARQNLELAQASRTKSEFLANMSHELRTPLNAILGFSDALRRGLLGRLSPQQEESVGDIHDSGEHLLSLINDILDLSKIESGKMELTLAPTDMQSLLQESLTLFKAMAIAGRIRLRLEMEAIGWALIDQRKTRQILYNLVSNAVKFTPEGGAVTLRMCVTDRPLRDGAQRIDNAAGNMPDGMEFLEISVIDTGIGISRDELDRLFQPFVQLDSGPARKFDGTGLGLALVKQLSELQGGRIAVKSRPGSGSEFIVWLPYRAVLAPPAVTNAGDQA